MKPGTGTQERDLQCSFVCFKEELGDDDVEELRVVMRPGSPREPSGSHARQGKTEPKARHLWDELHRAAGQASTKLARCVRPSSS